MTEGDLGARPEVGERCRFRVWAPKASSVEVRLSPDERVVPLEREERGYHAGVVDGVPEGTRYRYRLDGAEEFPDPASRLQPEGVHGPSQVVSVDFDWTDGAWAGRPLEELILYELHVGTFTREGTLDAAASRLERLRELGITAVELMPVAQFPGERNWGYDGVYPFAVQESYGGPRALARFVDACHALGLAVVLDVVYNHLGPEGNYLGSFAPYFTERYRTPWGQAINFDGADSDEVRHYFIENALQWIRDFHVDALRLDAVHAIVDATPYTFLEELADAVRSRAGRRAYIIPESAANDVRLIRPRERGGYGHDAVWNDDFHHTLRVLLTGERRGYFVDYGDGLEHVEKAFREGFVYSGEYSKFRRRRHGTSSAGIAAERFVVFSQNHDQIGNRMRGDRLREEASFEQVKLAAASVLLSPFVPLLFMGEEYGERAPFPYFVSHSEPELIEAVRRGRREEFQAFEWTGDPPDPQSETTFAAAVIGHAPSDDEQRALFAFYRELIGLRRSAPALRPSSPRQVHLLERERVLVVERSAPERGTGDLIVALHFGDGSVTIDVALARGVWRTALDSNDERFGGPGVARATRLDSDGGEVAIALGPWAAVALAGDPT